MALTVFFDFAVNSEVIQFNSVLLFSSFAEIQAALTDNVAGNFVTHTVNTGNTIRIDAVQASDLTAANFSCLGLRLTLPRRV